VQDRNPERAAQIANAVAQSYMDSNLEHKLEGNNSASAFLGDQVVAVGARLRQAEMALYTYRKQHQLLDVNLDARQSINIQNVQSFTQRLADLRVKKVELESARKLILAARDNLDQQETLPEVRQNLVVQQLRVMIVDMMKTLAEMETSYGEKHPKVESLKAKLARTRQEYVSEIDKLLKANENLYATVDENEKALNKLLEREKHDAIELSKLEVEYRPLVREAEDTQNLYKLVTQRQKETGLTGLVRNNNVRILDSAVAVGTPVKPRPVINVGLGIFVGLLLGIGGALGAEALDNTLKTQEEVEARLRAPVLGMLPIIGERSSKGVEQKDRDLCVFRDSKSAAAEACRSIRTNLMFLSPEEPIKSLVVTSPGPAEGKTTTAISIAIAMAQAGARVLLIDTDLRRPRLHRAFDFKNEIGISNAIVGEKPLDEVTFPTVVPNLWLCPCGPLPPNPAELIHTRRFAELMAECKRKYDKVILDSPPTSAVTDPVVIGNQADGVVLVVRAGHTTREAAAFARRQLDDGKARLLGSVVNRVDPADRYYNYYYSRYYRYYRSYQYGYGGDGNNAKA
jgi:capsular exopolysaccharide synthesis family protein